MTTTIYPKITLQAAGLVDLVLDEEIGVYGQKLDLGDAVTRAVVDDAPDADGTDDSTQFIGARSVTLQVIGVAHVDDSLWALRQRLRAFTHPKFRPVMILQAAADAPVQRIVLRRNQFSDVIGGGPAANAADITVQWVAPYGILESSELHDISGFAAGTSLAGRAYSLTFPRVYPASDPGGTISVTNDGTADAYPVIRLYGPCTEPVITSTTQDKSLAFVGLTLAGGEFIEIDTRAKTILFAADPTNSRYDLLDFPTSDWFTLSPGLNVLRFNPDTFTASSSFAQVLFRDAWL